MSKIRITKEFTMETAHALLNYDGACKNLHGHSYQLFVTVIGEPIADPNAIKEGMVIDFSDLKIIVKSQIIDVFDHAVVVNDRAFDQSFLETHRMFQKRIIVSYQPTCENLLIDFANRIRALLPENVELHSMRLHETATSYGEWYASDNM